MVAELIQVSRELEEGELIHLRLVQEGSQDQTRVAPNDGKRDALPKIFQGAVFGAVDLHEPGDFLNQVVRGGPPNARGFDDEDMGVRQVGELPRFELFGFGGALWTAFFRRKKLFSDIFESLELRSHQQSIRNTFPTKFSSWPRGVIIDSWR